MTTRIGKREVTRALKRLAKENPDKRNPHCHYTLPDGAPCCIIGNLMEEFKVPRPDYGTDDNGTQIANKQMTMWVEPFTPKAVQVMDEVQCVADTPDPNLLFERNRPLCHTWAEAVEKGLN
jgi:hypothetical protein